jgi:hypothetical protein
MKFKGMNRLLKHNQFSFLSFEWNFIFDQANRSQIRLENIIIDPN